MASKCSVIVVCVLISVVAGALDKEEGETCTDNGKSGTCKFAEACTTLQESLARGEMPTTCSFQGLRIVVCCVENSTNKNETTVKEPDIESRFGKIAREKCKEYSQYVWDIQENPTLSIIGDDEPVKKYDCALQNNELIVGGSLAAQKEFPHMALLGYAHEDTIRWACGGSIISPNFVLTASHCVKNREYGEVSKVRIGLTNLSETTYMQEFSVKDIYKHPKYLSSSHYHDIALLKLDRDAKLGPSARPACLHVEKDIPGTKCLACGWGNTEFAGSGSQDLLKVVLEFFDKPQCEKTYKNEVGTRRLQNGIDDDLMICAGSGTYLRDTCQGDSGGPLQVYNKQEGVKCMYDIIGVTSFGKACGLAVNIPGVYTRVSAYIDWIEKTVWPE